MDENISDLVDSAVAEAEAFRKAGKGQPAHSIYWQSLIDGLQTLKGACNQFESAYGAYDAIMRLIIDEWPNSDFPAMQQLGHAMEKWRRSENVRRKQDQGRNETSQID